MSFDPSQIPQLPYGGTPYYQVTNVGVKSALPNRFVALKVNWLQYFTLLNSAGTIAVRFDLTGNSNFTGTLDCIKSVKIDNSNSTVPVSVWFPDSGDIITCPPQTVITLPAMTNGLKGLIIAQGLAKGFTPTTTVFLTNFFLPTSIDPQVQLTFPQWIGSPDIQRNATNIFTPGYGPPALGDQAIQYQLDLTATALVPIFGTPIANGGFIYITGITVTFLDPFAGLTETPAIIMKGAISGQLYRWSCFILGNTHMPNGVIIAYNKSGLNLKLDATDTWTLQNTIALSGQSTSLGDVFFEYSVNQQ